LLRRKPIISNSEVLNIAGIIDDNCYYPGYHPCVMIGAQRTDPADGVSPFVWKFPNGTSRPLEYTHWNRGEPNNCEYTEACTKMYPVRDYKWNDSPCSMEACIMCEIDI